MASIRRRGAAWRAELYKDGIRESGTFATKQQAAAWATAREAELAGKRLPEYTVTDALRRFGREVCPGRKGQRWELARLGTLERSALGPVRLPGLRAAHVAEWKAARLAEVSGASVRREMNLMLSVFEAAIEWGWLHTNPARGVKKPPHPPSRKRRITQDEIDRVTLALGLTSLEAETAAQRTGLAFLFALETAMRAGEILGLTRADLVGKSARLADTKNGDSRIVPLSSRARAIIEALPKDRPTLFDLDAGTRDVVWRRARDAAKIPTLHFHDSRAEAIWRLSKKLDVMELARMIGHRDLRSLMAYYNTDPDDLADRL